MPALLDVRQLTVSYGHSLALSDVELVVPEGAVVGVLGPNGAGKSTLLKTVSGLVRPTAGEIVFDGEGIAGRSPSELAHRGICLIPEGRGILPTLTVSENLKLALGDDRAALSRVYERFPVLAHRSEQAAGTLSGGEQQMLALARALSDRARLLLVDEPSLGLAPRLVAMIEETLRDLHTEGGRTIVWVEQYVSRVLALADLVYILGRGRVVWCGDPSELSASPVLISSYLGGGSTVGDGSARRRRVSTRRRRAD